MSRATSAVALLGAALVSSAVLAQEFSISPELEARDQLVTVQQDLATIGFSTGTPDGQFGPRSRAAFASFLEQYGPDLPLALTPEARSLLREAAQNWTGWPWKAKLAPVWFLRAPKLALEWSAADQHDSLCGQRSCGITTFTHAAGDLTGDGRAEIVVSASVHATEEGDWQDYDVAGPLLIFSPTGDGKLVELTVSGAPDGSLKRVHPRSAVIEDFNGDGVGDLFVAAHGYDMHPQPGEQNVLVLSSPDGLVDASFTNLPIQNDFAHGCDAGDLDGDGDIDIIVSTHSGQADVESYVLWNDGTAHFKMQPLEEILDRDLAVFDKRGLKSRSRYNIIRIRDVDADGFLDLVLLTTGETEATLARFPQYRFSRIVFGDGAADWRGRRVLELPPPPFGSQSDGQDADMVDLDGDGTKELVVTNATSEFGPTRGIYLQIFKRDGETLRDATPQLMFPQGYKHENLSFVRDSFFHDLDLDGDMDLLIRTSESWTLGSRGDNDARPVSFAINNGGVLAPVDTWSFDHEGWMGRELVPMDFDLDGDVDIIGQKPVFQRIGNGGTETEVGTSLFLYENTTK